MAPLAAVRALAELGKIAEIETEERESKMSGATAAMAPADGNSIRIASTWTAALGTASARATAVGGSKQGKLLAVMECA